MSGYSTASLTVNDGKDDENNLHYILSYDLGKDKYEVEEARKELVDMLHQNGAWAFESHVESTIIFKSTVDIKKWNHILKNFVPGNPEGSAENTDTHFYFTLAQLHINNNDIVIVHKEKMSTALDEKSNLIEESFFVRFLSQIKEHTLEVIEKSKSLLN